MDGLDLSQIPAGMPPAGVVPNFIDPPSQEQLPKIFTYVTLPPMVIFLALRIYTRIKYNKLGLDDILCTLSAVTLIAYVALIFTNALANSSIVIDQAAGPHMWDIPLSKITVSYAQNCVTLTTVYMISAMFIKAAILVLYDRVLTPSRTARIMFWSGIGFTVVFYLAIVIVFCAGCVPRSEDYPTGGYLSPQYAARCYKFDGRVSATTGIVGTIIDFYILIVPLPVLWGLHLNFKRKAGIYSIFVAGSAACIVSLVGTVYRMRIAPADHDHQDLSWNGMPIYATSIAELTIGISCSCMPVVVALFRGFSSWSKTWISKLRYSVGSRDKYTDQSNGSDMHIIHHEGLEKRSNQQAPQRLSGMRSFVHNISRSRSGRPQAAPATNNLQSFDSVDLDYHEQLKQQARAPNAVPC